MTSAARDPWSDSFASVRVVAALFNVNRKLVYRMIRDGTLPHVRMGYAVRIPMRAVRSYVEQQLAGRWSPWKRRRKGGA